MQRAQSLTALQPPAPAAPAARITLPETRVRLPQPQFCSAKVVYRPSETCISGEPFPRRFLLQQKTFLGLYLTPR